MRECTIKREERGALEIVTLDGALDSHAFPRLESVLGELQAQERYRVILNCAGLDYISSAALGALIGFSRRMTEKGGGLTLTNLSTKIEGVVRLLGFQKILQIEADIDSALATLAKENVNE